MVVFVSNYINHHQLPFCECMLEETAGDFVFIETESMEEERIHMGWGVKKPLSFVRDYRKEREACDALLLSAEHVIFGGARDEEIIRPRLLQGKPTIRYSERLYKEGQWKFISPRGLKQKYHDHGQFRKDPVYLLCAGAFVAGDFSLVRAYPGKKYTWGYFPEVITYEDLWEEKQKARQEICEKEKLAVKAETPLILWTGRQIDWKRPEQMIYLAGSLKEFGEDYHILMIGDGALHDKLVHFAVSAGVADKITFLPFMQPEAVRKYMLAADFYCMTSDQKEGWGAVVNEAMNSGCVVMGSSVVGAVPSLLEDRTNGLVFDGRHPDTMALILMETKLLQNAEARKEIGMAAYETVRTLWNPGYAAKVLYTWMSSGYQEYPTEGPLSLAPLLWPKDGLTYTRRKIKGKR